MKRKKESLEDDETQCGNAVSIVHRHAASLSSKLLVVGFVVAEF
jgi:hypothetical protein